jgi:uncharacterized protein
MMIDVMSLLSTYLRRFVLIAILMFAGAAHAQPDEEARTAYESGDFVTAYRIWSELAEQNDGRAQYALGVMYATGSGREPDSGMAFEWFSKAAENGHLKAMYNLGIAYWTGEGTLEDKNEATHWWRMAAERGDIVSQYNLGVAYYNGLGVDQDLVEAARWIRSAAEQNYETALELLPALEEKLRETRPVDSTVATSSNGQVATNTDASGDTQVDGTQDTSSTAPSDTESATSESATDRTIDVSFVVGSIQSDSASVYAINNSGAPVIENLVQGTPVKVIESGNGWTKIEAASGFKLWVFGTYVSGEGENARITGDGVRARSLPSTADNSASPGQFNNNDTVTVLKTEGDWKYVQSPPHLHAWVQSSDVTVLDNATESWADRWRAAGGSL